MVEVFPGCRSREISSEFQGVLESGWNQVAAILQGIGVGEIANLKEFGRIIIGRKGRFIMRMALDM